MQKKTPTVLFSFPARVGAAVLIVTIAVILVTSNLLYNRTVTLLTENLRERLLSISITTAANIDAADLAVLKTEEDWTTDAWKRVVTKMNNAKYSNDDIVFMYIFRKIEGNESQMEFVADADSINPYANTQEDPSKFVDVNRDGIIEPDGPDKLQWPGQPYPEAVDIPEAFAAYEGPLSSAELYTDEYGTVMTGYAPIYDRNGEVAAILATDIKADDFFIITSQTLAPFVFFISLLTIVITLLILYATISSARYSVKLQVTAKQLEKANARLQKLDKQKSEFVSIASHQLRSPLTSIRGYASMLLEGSFGNISQKVKEPIERIEASAKHMTMAVEDYLNVSRIEAGNMKYELTDFNLRDEIEHIADDVRPVALKEGLVVLFRTDLKSRGLVHADIGKTAQIAHNLINNAIKYTKEGTITVFVRDDIAKKQIYVDIVDTGVGMSEDTLHGLFQKFSRAENANQVNTSGTGLGLFVALKMAEAMGGTIEAHSAGEGKGSRFTLVLPLVM